MEKDKQNHEGTEVYQKLYRYMIRILLYAMDSRLDVMQAIGIVARFQSAPREAHVQVVKRIIRYLKGTLEFGLWYPKGEEFFLDNIY